MRYLTLGEVVALHDRILEQTGGATGIRELGLLESAKLHARALFLDVLADELREEARFRSPLALQSSEHPQAILS